MARYSSPMKFAALVFLATASLFDSHAFAQDIGNEAINTEIAPSEEMSEILPETPMQQTQVDESEIDDNTLVIAPIEKSHPRIGYKGSPVTETQLTLFGRGNDNPKSHEVITLACVGAIESKDSALRKCDMLQFVLIDAKKQATWASDSFYYGTKKAFKNRMKHIEQLSRAPSIFDSDIRQLPGCLIAFGGAAFLIATVSTGVGVADFSVVVLTIIGRKKDWDMIDFITPLPRLLVSSVNARPFLATADKTGWSWAESPVRMRAKKFDRLKHMLTYRDQLPN